MKNAFLVLTLLSLVPVNAMADLPALGNPFPLLALAKTALAPYMGVSGILSLRSVPRSKVTSSGADGDCNPVAWEFLLAPEHFGRDQVTAKVTVFEEAYADFVDGKLATKCVPSAHFVIQDASYPLDVPLLSSALLATAMPLDDAAALARHSGMKTIDEVFIRQTMGYGRYPTLILYAFYGTDLADKPANVTIDATNKTVSH